MPQNNRNLNKSKAAKNNDEFYTRMEDIQKELRNYEEHLRDKIIYCNCDTPESNFVKFFTENFERLGLRDFRFTGMKDGKGVDFRSPESVNILKQSDVVITNPPFSLFREFMKQVIPSGKKFLVIGASTSFTYDSVFPHVVSGDVRSGVSLGKSTLFNTPEGQKKIKCSWITNLEHGKMKRVEMSESYLPLFYPFYDNFDAINVDKIKDIPKDYFGKMGVPATFFDFHDDRFEILGTVKKKLIQKARSEGRIENRVRLNGKEVFTRVLIQRKN